MPKKRFSAEQIVELLRQIEVSMAQGKPTPVAYWDAGISLQSFYRGRKEYGGLEIDHAKRMSNQSKYRKGELLVGECSTAFSGDRILAGSAKCRAPRLLPDDYRMLLREYRYILDLALQASSRLAQTLYY